MEQGRAPGTGAWGCGSARGSRVQWGRGTSVRGMPQEGLKATGQAEGLPLKMEQRRWALGGEDGAS